MKAGGAFASAAAKGYNGLEPRARRPRREATMIILDLPAAGIVADDSYSFTYPPQPERYEGLAEKFPGLPLLVVDAGPRVVCGHDYLLLLRRRREERAMTLQVDLSPAECLLLNYNLLETLFGLNLFEKLLFVGKILPLLPAAEIRRRAGLGFALSESLLEHLPLLLSGPFRGCLAAGRLGLKTALKLAGQNEADRLAQLAIFQACRFSESEQWRLAQMLEEIAFREKKPLAAVTAAGGLPALLASEMPQQRVLAAVHELRYPAFSRREKEWQAWRRQEEARSGVALSHAPFFAREEVQVTWTVKDRQAAEKLLQRLKKTAER
jgi:hypothetical protein